MIESERLSQHGYDLDFEADAKEKAQELLDQSRVYKTRKQRFTRAPQVVTEASRWVDARIPEVGSPGWYKLQVIKTTDHTVGETDFAIRMHTAGHGVEHGVMRVGQFGYGFEDEFDGDDFGAHLPLLERREAFVELLESAIRPEEN